MLAGGVWLSPTTLIHSANTPWTHLFVPLVNTEHSWLVKAANFRREHSCNRVIVCVIKTLDTSELVAQPSNCFHMHLQRMSLSQSSVPAMPQRSRPCRASVACWLRQGALAPNPKTTTMLYQGIRVRNTKTKTYKPQPRPATDSAQAKKTAWHPPCSATLNRPCHGQALLPSHTPAWSPSAPESQPGCACPSPAGDPRVRCKPASALCSTAAGALAAELRGKTT